jgi:hypothetical protein
MRASLLAPKLASFFFTEYHLFTKAAERNIASKGETVEGKGNSQ